MAQFDFTHRFDLYPRYRGADYFEPMFKFDRIVGSVFFITLFLVLGFGIVPAPWSYIAFVGFVFAFYHEVSPYIRKVYFISVKAETISAFYPFAQYFKVNWSDLVTLKIQHNHLSLTTRDGTEISISLRGFKDPDHSLLRGTIEHHAKEHQITFVAA
jgi:hypothetical protein